ncbi:MAG TPA: hypothetical protein VMU17_07415, partial [Elusimicrobiota bacterium]|nr:hypothetical protein [Elusimicrobiota bacterium]
MLRRYALIAAVFSAQWWFTFPHGTPPKADRQAFMHTQVLAGQAKASYQYQMYVADWMLEAALRRLPVRTPKSFSWLYAWYYWAATLAALALLFRLCRRSASLNSST